VGHAEPRVRAAALGAFAAMWKSGEPTDQRAIADALTAALGARDAGLADAAIEATEAVYEAIGAGDRGWLDAAVIARATAERDPELAAAVLELIGKRKLAAGAEACRAGLAGDPVRSGAAVHCLTALGEPAPVPAAVAEPTPPVDVATVIGHRLRWRVTTSRGEIAIQLAPQAAPWAVAAIVALTRKGFYDGLEFHRVVPDFVVQGGDPTESGSGGPGFQIPAEPSALGDGTGYLEGGVGIADSGRDSGGSQWFIMHSRAPHLDGRYTWIGAVEAGQKAADALLVGDRILRATVEQLPSP
jgi:cyclophilin family peptidyl-prolyl cis-trans isomerase